MITAISASIELLVYLVLRDTLIPLILWALVDRVVEYLVWRPWPGSSHFQSCMHIDYGFLLLAFLKFLSITYRYANSLMATLNARSTLTIPVRKSREDGHTRKKFSLSGRTRDFKDAISRLFGIKQADTSLPTSCIELVGGTRKNFSFSERIRNGKDTIFRRFGMKRTDNTFPMSGIEIEIDIQKTASSVLDIRRYSLKSIIGSGCSLEENSIVGSNAIAVDAHYECNLLPS